MPRLPDRTSLGQRTIADGQAPVYEDQSAEILSQGVGNAIERVQQNYARHARHDDELNYARAKQNLVAADVGLRNKFADDDDWATHEPRYNEAMTKAREDAAKLIRGSQSRALFEQAATIDTERGLGEIRAQAKVKEAQWGRSALDETLTTSRVAALEAKDEATRASLVDGVISGINGARDKRYITPEQATQVRQAWTAQYGEGFVEMKPAAEQMKLLKSPKGTPADFIDPAKRSAMLERLEDQQRIAVDRREARAERAMGQIERQISSGIPATDAMWKEWNQTIAGTSVAGELKGLLAGEKEVQDTLRKPIGEQIRLAQEKEAALMKNGGTLAQAANVNRLKTAVQKNVALLQNEPLLFAEERLDAPSVPVDITSITDPSTHAALGAVFQERAAQIRTLSKHFEAPVPMKPLLSQEAKQLAFALDNASPAQTSELLSSLRDATGSNDVFKGAMQQIAPDAPVKAVAGLLAAQRRELVTNSHWFKADESVTGRDVSATLIQGDRLLNPSKGDKAQDGKPQAKSIYLPDADTLQARFQKEVGTAFAGRPGAADIALQAVRAYYVGRAAQVGRIAEDNTDVDTKIVKEAVRNTLGSIIDYNGGGEVLAPWGMSESDFEDRAEIALSARAKELNLDANDFGLANASGDGVYAVTLGRKPVLDERGMPVVVSIKPNDSRDARGYIDRSKK